MTNNCDGNLLLQLCELRIENNLDVKLVDWILSWFPDFLRENNFSDPQDIYPSRLITDFDFSKKHNNVVFDWFISTDNILSGRIEVEFFSGKEFGTIKIDTILSSYGSNFSPPHYKKILVSTQFTEDFLGITENKTVEGRDERKERLLYLIKPMMEIINLFTEQEKRK